MVSNLKCLRFNKTDLIIKYLISDIGKTVNKVDGVQTLKFYFPPQDGKKIIEEISEEN
jgi:hypothetical protein